jgi:ArsR family transcriptional regulator
MAKLLPAISMWVDRGLYLHYSGDMEKHEVIGSLGALAHPLRLDVFRALVVAGLQGRTPGQLAEDLGGIPSATMSFHLKELAAAGLVSQQRASRNIVYRAACDQMNGLLGYLTENCCQGAECAVTQAPVARRLKAAACRAPKGKPAGVPVKGARPAAEAVGPLP